MGLASAFSRIRRIADAGTGHPDVAPHSALRRRIRIVNWMGLVCAAFAFCSLPYDWLTMPAWMVGIDLASITAYLLVPCLNHWGRHRIARLLFFLFSTAIIVFGGIQAGPAAGIELFFFSLALFGAMLFESHERAWVLSMAAVPTVAYFWMLGRYDSPSANYFIYSAAANFFFITVGTYVLIRTGERMESDLEQSRAAAIHAEKMAALGEMSSGIAHEINTPLTVMHLQLQKLRRRLQSLGSTDPQAVESISSMEDMVKRITAVTRAMQGFARHGQFDPLEPTSITDIVRNTLELCRERFKLSGVELMLESCSPEPILNCRPVEISQVLLNLLNNAHQAVTAYPEKWVRIRITEESGNLRIRVADSGIGIDPGIRDRIFQPFFTTKPPGQGTGLGLSVSKNIVESHHGRLHLSTESTNTEFVLEFPR